MREKKFTAGPWEPVLFDDESCSVASYVDEPVGLQVCGMRPHESCASGKYMSIEERIANAHLIASAPELLEALEDVCNFLEVLMSHCSVDQLAHEEGFGEIYEKTKHSGGKHTKLLAQAYGETP